MGICSQSSAKSVPGRPGCDLFNVCFSFPTTDPDAGTWAFGPPGLLNICPLWSSMWQCQEPGWEQYLELFSSGADCFVRLRSRKAKPVSRRLGAQCHPVGMEAGMGTRTRLLCPGQHCQRKGPARHYSHRHTTEKRETAFGSVLLRKQPRSMFTANKLALTFVAYEVGFLGMTAGFANWDGFVLVMQNWKTEKPKSIFKQTNKQTNKQTSSKHWAGENTTLEDTKLCSTKVTNI